MISGTIIWIGPVSASNLSSVNLPQNWDIVTVAQEAVASTQTGGVALTPTMFRNYAPSLGADPLGTLMKRSKVSPEKAVLASFSAGAGLLDPILIANAGDPRIQAVLSADSYYGLALKSGYSAQAIASIANGTPFYLTTSSTKGGVTIHSGEESVAPFATAMGLVSTNAVPPGMPPPVSGMNKANVWWLDYASEFAHVEHATKLAPLAINAWFSVLAGTPIQTPNVAPDASSVTLPPLGGQTSVAPLLLAGVAGAIGGYFSTQWILRR